MKNLEVNLNIAMNILNGNFKFYKDFYKFYTFTTENISGYLKYFDLKNKSLLTVGSSADQILNAYLCGARDITLYDINPNAIAYAYFKIAAIIELSYKEFQEFFFKRGLEDYYNEKTFSKKIFNKFKYTLRLLDYESFLFFDELFDLYEVSKIRNYLFDDDEERNEVIKGFNIYLRNEDTYNMLKKSLKSIYFNFICGDIFKDNIEGKWDNIFLSNLCTTTNIDNFKELLKRLDENNLKENGSILLGYLWNIKFEQDNYKDNWADIYKIPITRNKLKDYITEHYNIKSALDFLWNENKKNDLVLIYRKNK